MKRTRLRNKLLKTKTKETKVGIQNKETAVYHL